MLTDGHLKQSQAAAAVTARTGNNILFSLLSGARRPRGLLV